MPDQNDEYDALVIGPRAAGSTYLGGGERQAGLRWWPTPWPTASGTEGEPWQSWRRCG